MSIIDHDYIHLLSVKRKLDDKFHIRQRAVLDELLLCAGREQSLKTADPHPVIALPARRPSGVFSEIINTLPTPTPASLSDASLSSGSLS
ncbi:TPA: hypothetical protein R3915_000435 [Salmonella enterica subsp. enterica serovar Isangi]|nr:hypothetical protein [Salmonella enterica]MDJ7268287.1 hypothetical protein [Salmonella enterica]HEC7271635.1 hypothetical protein [Salmonella enterica subsp. enterica serovar Isangi]